MSKSSNRTGAYATAALLVWFLIAAIGGWMGVLNAPGKPPIFIGASVVVPIAFGLQAAHHDQI